MAPKCPCRGCTKRGMRRVGGVEKPCHSVCKKYIEWRKELDALNELERKKKAVY